MGKGKEFERAERRREAGIDRHPEDDAKHLNDNEAQCADKAADPFKDDLAQGSRPLHGLLRLDNGVDIFVDVRGNWVFRLFRHREFLCVSPSRP